MSTDVPVTDAPPAFYDSLGKRYEDSFAHDEGFLQFIKASLDQLPAAATVLDIGCGTGKPTSSAIVASGRKVYGIDFSPVMLELSRKQVPQGTFELCDMRAFSPPQKFDAAFANFSLFHVLTDETSALAEKFAQWVVPGGYLFIGTMVADDFEVEESQFDEGRLWAKGIVHTFMGKRNELTLFTRKGWGTMLEKAGFSVVKTEMVPFQPPLESQCEAEPHYYITARREGE